MSNSFTFNDIDFDTLGVNIVQPFNVPVLGNYDIKLKSIVGKSGAYNFGAVAEQRELALPCRITADDTATFYANAFLLAKYLNPAQGEKKLYLDCVSGKYLLAMLEKGFSLPKISNYSKFSLPFVCADPHWYSDTETTSSKSITSNPQQFTETPSGYADSEPLWEIIPITTISSGTDIVIQNFTSNQKMTWEAPEDITSSDVVRIDTATWCVYLNGVRSIATIQPASTYPLLVGGVANVIRVTGVELGTLRIIYRNRWL
ncbi:MAG: phage tail family protein [Sphaerochaeta sp.]|jgi:phage-related protein|nr:phage tail family protein [Sphaerochaeta sp.]